MLFTRSRLTGYVFVLLCVGCLLAGSTGVSSRSDEESPSKLEVLPMVPDLDSVLDQDWDAIPEPDMSLFNMNDTVYFNLTTIPPYIGPNPGFRARVTQKALDYATKLAIDIMMSQIEFLSIPDIQQTIGSIDVQVRRVRILRFDRPKAGFIPHPGSGISLKIWDLNVKVMALYDAQMGLGFFGVINKSGTLSIRTKDMSLTVELLIEKQPWTGLPSKLVPICSSSGDLIITFKGGWSDMLNVGSSVFANTIRSVIASQVCAAAQTEIDKNLNSEDGSLLFNQTILGLFDFQYTMTDFPVFTEHFVESSHLGATYYINRWEEPPFSPAPIPDFGHHKDRMFYVYVSDYVLNSAFHAAFISGKLSYNVTADLLDTLPIPDQFRHMLDTSCESPFMCLGVLYPGLAKHYPGGQVTIKTNTTEAPHVTFYDGHSVRVRTSGTLEFLVESYGQVYPAFCLSFTVSVDVSLVVKRRKISFRLNDISPSVGILYSNVDDVGTSFFYETIIRAGTRAALPFIEEFGEKGFAIPEILNLKIENSEIIVIEEPGVFVVATDLRVLIPKGINLIAMLGPQNDTTVNNTESTANFTKGDDQVTVDTTDEPLSYETTSVGITSKPKVKRRRDRNQNRRRRTTTTTMLPPQGGMDDYVEQIAEVAEGVVTELLQLTTPMPVPRRRKSKRKVKRVRDPERRRSAGKTPN